MCEPENDQWNLRNEKGKDGMILLLTGQVDKRNQEVVHLRSSVQQLQSAIKGSDGSITLLKYQLAAARVGDSHNASMSLSQPSHVHISPDRQSLLLHLKRSRPVLKDILSRMKAFPVRYPIAASHDNAEKDVSSAPDNVTNSSTVTSCNRNLPIADDFAQCLGTQEQQNKQLEEQIVELESEPEPEMITNTAIPTSSETFSKGPTTSSELTEAQSPSTIEIEIQKTSPTSITAPLLAFRSPIKEESNPAEDNHRPSSDAAAIKHMKENGLGSNTSSSSPSPRVMQSLFNGLRQSSPSAGGVKVVDAETPSNDSKGMTLQSLPSSPAAPLSVPLSTLLNVDNDDDNKPPFLSSLGTSPSLGAEPPLQQQQQHNADRTASPSSSPVLQTVLMTPIKSTSSINTGNGSSNGGGRDAFAVSTPGGSNVTFSATMDRIRRIKQKAEAQSSRDRNKSNVTVTSTASRFVAKVVGEDGSGADGRSKGSQAASKSDASPTQHPPPSKELALAPSVISSDLCATANKKNTTMSHTHSTQHDNVKGTSVESTMRSNTPSKTLSRLLGGVVSPTPAVRPLGNTVVHNKENRPTKFTNGNRPDDDKENNAPVLPLPQQSQSKPHPHHQDGVAANSNTPLSPEQFSNEVVRLKRENGSIRDDILRFRGTLQRLREECQASATAVISTGGHAVAIVGRSGGTGGKGLEPADDVSTVLPNSHHHQPYYSRPYHASREDTAVVSSSSSSYSYLPRAGVVTSNGNSHHHRSGLSVSSSATSTSRIESFLLGSTQRRPPLSTTSLASYPLHPPAMTTASSSSSLSSSTSTKRYYEDNNNTVGNGNGSPNEQGEGSDQRGMYLQYQSLQSFSTNRRNIPLPPTHNIQQQPMKQYHQQQKGLYGMPPTQKAASRLPLSSNNLTFADIDPTMIW